MVYFCFVHTRPSRTPHMVPLDAETIHEAKVQARRLMTEHVASSVQIYLDADEVAVLEAQGGAS